MHDQHPDAMDLEIENVMNSFDDDPQIKKESSLPDTIYIFPLARRPFFPGMAAPLVLEPGPFYEVLKIVAKSEHKCVGLLLSKMENADIYKVGFNDLYQ